MAKEKITVPSPIDTNPQQPSGDYSYTLEIVMGMQSSMGKLIEAVDGLKSQSKSQSEKLDKVVAQIYAAKVVLVFIGILIAGAAGVFAFSVKTYLDYLRLLK